MIINGQILNNIIIRVSIKAQPFEKPCLILSQNVLV